MILLQSSCFPRREESAGRAENILSASSDSKMTSPHPRDHQALFFSPFPSQEDLMLWLVLGWCLALTGEPCWLSHREVGSWFPTPPPWASAPRGVLQTGRSPGTASRGNEPKGSSFLICSLFQPKLFGYPRLASINTDSMEKMKSKMCLNTAFKST